MCAFAAPLPSIRDSTPPAPTCLPSPPRGAAKLVEVCLLPTESAGVALGIATTKALVEARHMVREKTEVNVPVIILLQLPLLLWLVAKMKATGVASTTAGLRWSRRIQIGATAMIVATYLPLSSGSLLPARMQHDVRANPLFLLIVPAPTIFIDRPLLVPCAAEAMEAI